MENVNKEPSSSESELIEDNEGTPRDELEQSESDDVSQFSLLSIHSEPFSQGSPCRYPFCPT